MGIRESEQSLLWVAAAELPKSPGHPFYMRLNALLTRTTMSKACAAGYGRSWADRAWRLARAGGLLRGDSERGIAWRATDSRCAAFCGSAWRTPRPHSISRTRRLIDVETHRAIFTWVQQRLVEAGLLKGKTVAIDATTLEANAAMRSIVRRDTGESYQAFLTGLATASGIETPTREDLARVDKKRKKKTSNKEWTNPHDPDAKVTKMKDGRTHLAHKAEHAVDLDTGAIVAVTLQGADQGDTTTIVETVTAAAEQVEDAQRDSRRHRHWTNWSATRGITATRRWWTSTRSVSGRTSPSRTEAAATGRRRRTRRRRSMAIAAGCMDDADGA